MVMDMRATNHIHNNQCILHFHLDNNISLHVLVEDGSKIHVVVTKLTLLLIKNSHRPLYLNNVLITPNIIQNLIFIRRFTHNNKCSIKFDRFGFTFKDYRTCQPLIRCDSDSPLYPVLLKPLQVLLSASSTIWHQHHGHPRNMFFNFWF